MSRTYRTLEYVEFCNRCNRPLWQHTVEVYELCDCEPEYVEMEVQDWRWKTVGYEYSELFEREMPIREQYYNGTKIVKQQLPRSTYTRYNMKAYDGDGHWWTRNNSGIRKDAQNYFNSKVRQETHNELKNRSKDYDEMTFPVIRKQVDWEIW